MRRRYKYPLVLTAVVVGLLLLVLAVVQVVLWTDIPKKIVMGQIEKELGLHISADTLRTSLLGNSTLTGVELRLPAATQSFLKVDKLTIKHNTLIGLAIGQAVAVDSIGIEHPVVYVVQDQQGRWNLQQVAELLARAGGGTTAQQSTQQPAKTGGIPKLPAITLTNGEVHVVDNQRRTADLMPLTVKGTPDGLLLYRYDAAVGDSITAVGFVQPGTNWVHQVDVTVGHLDGPLKGFLNANGQHLSTFDARCDASWHGRVDGGKFAGQMAIKSLTMKDAPNVGDVNIDGGFGVSVDGATVTVSPDRLRIAVGPTTRPAVSVDSGAIVSDPTGVHARKVELSIFGGKGLASADFDPKTQDLDLRVEGSGLSVRDRVTHGGTLTASVRQPFAGQPVIRAELVSHGQVGDSLSPDATWDARLNLTGSGTSWNDIDWVLEAPRLAYKSADKTVDLSRLSSHVTQRLPVVRLTDLTLPQTSVAGGSASVNVSGQYNDSTQDWNFDTSAEFTGTYNNAPVPMKLAVRADGNGVTKGIQTVNLKRMRFDVGQTFVTADGRYDARKPKPTTTAPGVVPPTPIALHVKLDQTPTIAAVSEGPVQGTVDGDFSIVGDLFKDDDTAAKGGRRFSPYLNTNGLLRSHDLIVLGKPIGDINIKLDGATATPDPDQWSVTQLRSTEFNLLNAPWTLSLDFPVNDKAVLTLGVRNLSIDVLGKVAGVSGFEGRVTTAKWTVTAGGPSLDDIDVDSHYVLNDLKQAGRPVNLVDSVDAKLSMHKGVVRLEPLLARNGKGTVTTTASFDLHQGRELTSRTEVRDWPYPLSDSVDVHASADADLRVEIRKPNQFHDETRIFTTGAIKASADVIDHNAVKNLTLAHTDLEATFRDRTINLTRLTGNALNGTFSGSATADIEKPLEAVGRIEFKDVDVAMLTVINPEMLTGLRGVYSGTIAIAPATHEPRPIGPVRIDVNVACDNGGYRSINIGGDRFMAVHAVAYLDKDRAVLDHSTIAVAGGTVNVWARLGRKFTSQLITLEFKDLDLDQLAHITPSIKGPMPGRVNGRFGMVSSGPDITTLLAEGQISLTRSDLVNFGPLRTLYNALNAGGGGVQPTGVGSINLSMEQGTLRVAGFKYFNRGIDAGGIATVGPLDFVDIENTPVWGQVAGAARPLKGSNVPGFQELDELSGAFQGTLTTFNIRGPLRDVAAGKNITPAGLDEIGSSIKDIFGGRAGK